MGATGILTNSAAPAKSEEPRARAGGRNDFMAIGHRRKGGFESWQEIV